MNQNPLPMDEQSYERDPLAARLDEALRAENVAGGVPADLAERILAATSGQLPQPRGGVIARIGTATWWRALAAAVMLAASIAALWMARQDNVPQGPTAAGGEVSNLGVIERQLTQLARYQESSNPIDRDLKLLALQLTQAEGGQSQWDTMQEEVQQDLLNWEVRPSGNTAAMF